MRIFKHVFFRQNSGKAIAESPSPQNNDKLGFSKRHMSRKTTNFSKFRTPFRKSQNETRVFQPPFLSLYWGGGGHPGMALGFWGSEIGVARVGACLDYPHDRSRFFSKRRLSFLLGNEAL